MVLGKLIWVIVGQGPIALRLQKVRVEFVWTFLLSYIFSLFFSVFGRQADID